jgi:hypothetical protein
MVDLLLTVVLVFAQRKKVVKYWQLEISIIAKKFLTRINYMLW